MGCCITMKFSEKRIDIAMNLPNKLMQWHAELRTATRKQLPFTSIDAKCIDPQLQGFNYSMLFLKKKKKKSDNGSVLTLTPQRNKLTLCLKQQ